MAYIDNFTKQEIENIVANCTSYRELAKKLGYVSLGNNFKTIQKRLDEYNISTAHFTGMAKGAVKRNEENVFCIDSTASQKVLREWYLKGNYTEYKCSICGLLPFWNGKELVLTLDHINGNNHDNRLENLRWICPNCDRQLPTFAGKNIKTHNSSLEEENHCKGCGVVISKKATFCVNCSSKNKRVVERPSKEQLIQDLFESNFVQVGKKYGVSDNAVRKWCRSYDISDKSSDYKNRTLS